PVRTRRVARKSMQWWLLLCMGRAGRVWLERRPAPGIWAGLYCPPDFDRRGSLLGALGAQALAARGRAAVSHGVKPRDLLLHRVLVAAEELPARDARAVPDTPGGWFGPQEWAALGLPAPVRTLLNSLEPGSSTAA